jgi:hypothetical protein
MMDLASKIQKMDFSEDQIDGGVEGVCVDKEEDMLVAMCHIAECMTFNRPIDFEMFNVELQRQKIIDVFLTLLNYD